LIFFVAVLSPLSFSASFSFTGSFAQDNSVGLYPFTLNAPASVTLETWSYGGGTDATGQSVPKGGFETDLALFSGSGGFVNYVLAGSGCPPGNTDAGLCGDSLLTQSLPAGRYTVAVTEYFNIPNGNLSAGFLEDLAGNFTGPDFCGTTGGFFDTGCNKRTGNFELDIVGATTAAAVPEPASILLFGSAVVVVAAVGVRRRRKISRS
jgi:hypothetical protein